MLVTVKSKGNFNKTKKFFAKALKLYDSRELIKIADSTVIKLKNASPYESIAKSWSYTLKNSKDKVVLTFENSEIQNGINLAILTNDGYATKDGKWISGKHYIEEPIQEAYKKIIKETWEELKSI